MAYFSVLYYSAKIILQASSITSCYYRNNKVEHFSLIRQFQLQLRYGQKIKRLTNWPGEFSSVVFQTRKNVEGIGISCRHVPSDSIYSVDAPGLLDSQ